MPGIDAQALIRRAHTLCTGEVNVATARTAAKTAVGEIELPTLPWAARTLLRELLPPTNPQNEALFTNELFGRVYGEHNIREALVMAVTQALLGATSAARRHAA
ncbi:MAG TPA: hypothetical protein VLA88_04220 [Candidatus Saccharimonadales bacterium]|nr:hypothetical protein [Candidatus Saccharimonadales bacterium]